MTPTQQFIEVKRWLKDANIQGWDDADFENGIPHFVYLALLKPECWQAVGKTRGWETYKPGGSFYVGESSNQNYPRWKKPWHFFIDHLADGKTIDEALAAIR